jgi:TrmH family RNA methyltransferase
VYRRDSIGEEAMKRISALASPSPVLAVIRKPSDAYVDDISSLKGLISEGGLFLALDTIRDPGNLGTIIRIADWFGIKAIFAAKDTVDVFNPKVVQATMGAVFRVRLHYVDLPELTGMMTGLGGKVYGTFLDGNNMYGRDLLQPHGLPDAGGAGIVAAVGSKLVALLAGRLTASRSSSAQTEITALPVPAST